MRIGGDGDEIHRKRALGPRAGGAGIPRLVGIVVNVTIGAARPTQTGVADVIQNRLRRGRVQVLVPATRINPKDSAADGSNSLVRIDTDMNRRRLGGSEQSHFINEEGVCRSAVVKSNTGQVGLVDA